jgi:hypothetical protein
VYPSSAGELGADVLSAEQVAEWRHNGTCAVDSLWPAELIGRVKADADRIFRGVGVAAEAVDEQEAADEDSGGIHDSTGRQLRGLGRSVTIRHCG